MSQVLFYIYSILCIIKIAPLDQEFGDAAVHILPKLSDWSKMCQTQLILSGWFPDINLVAKTEPVG